MRWGFLGWILGLAAVALTGGAIYAWGAGWFWPCERLGIPFSNGACASVAHFDNRNVGTFTTLANGNLLVATLAKGTERTDPIALVEVDATTGAIIAETPLPGISLEARPAGIAVSRDETLVALSLYDERTKVITRDGTEVLSIDRWLPAFLAFDNKGWLLTDMGRHFDAPPDPDGAEAWDINNPASTPVAASIADWSALFRQGVSAALSPDGDYFAQKLDQPHNSPVTGIRIGYIGDERDGGMFLGVNLRPDCSYATSEISFSPFGPQVAAEFSCPERWGQTSTALAVWDYEKSEQLLVLPGIDYFDTLHWASADTILVDRYNFGPETTDILRVKVPGMETP